MDYPALTGPLTRPFRGAFPPPLSPRWRRLAAGFFFSLFFVLTATADTPSTTPLFSATLTGSHGRPVALGQYRGTPLVVNFWARWCPPCRAEIPALRAFRRQQQGRIEVLGIGIENDIEPVQEFVRAQEMDYPVFVAATQGIPLMKALGNQRGGLPYTVFIDRHGQVVGTKLGLLREADLEALTPLLTR